MPSFIVFFIIGFGILILLWSNIVGEPFEEPKTYIGAVAFAALFFYFIFKVIKKTKKRKKHK
tara:strand:+ start:753 stop:938 length:186 start_codon:yes stop_codon:yes gene_type:complete